MSKHIIPLIPPHNVYVEVFGGAANVLINKPKSNIEVYNDINSDLVTLWRVIRDKEKLQELKRLLYLTPHSREEYYYLKQQNPETLSDIERAYRFYYLCRNSFSGHAGGTFSYCINNTYNKSVHDYVNSIDKLDVIHERFKYVTIEHESFEKLIPRYDSPNTLFYLDPPYVLDTRIHRKYYKHELSNEQHKQLISILLNTKGMCILSAYMHEIYQPLLDNSWEKIEINTLAWSKVITREIHAKNPSKESQAKRTEIIFLNPQCINALKQSNILSN